MNLTEEFRKTYTESKKKYPQLPSCEALNDEFELEDHFQERKYIPQHLLRHIRRRIADYLGFWANTLQSTLVPPPGNMILNQEYQELNEDYKQRLIPLIQKAMHHTRHSLLLELEKDEQKDAEYITKTYQTLKELQPELKQFTQQLTQIWEKPPQTSKPTY